MDQALENNKIKNESVFLGIFLLFLVVLYSLFLAFYSRLDLYVVISFCIIGLLSVLIIVFSPRVFSLSFFLGVYSLVMFYIAAFNQYANNYNIWNVTFFNDTDYLFTNFLIIIFLLSFSIGYFWGRKKIFLKKRKKVKDANNMKPRCTSISILLLTIINIVILVVLYLFFGLEYFQTRGSTLGNSIMDFVFLSFLPKYSLACMIITLWKYKYRQSISMFICLLINIIIYYVLNPIGGISRSDLLVLLVIIFGVFDKKFNNKIIFLILIFVGIVLIMPFMNFFKTLDTSYISNPFNFDHPDYDSYQMIMTTVQYTHFNGFSYGKNILTAIFFYIPRSVWNSKSLNSGEIVLTYFNSNFTNVSCPIVAEFYFCGGIFGVIALSIVFGILCKKIDNLYYRNDFLSNSILFSIIGMFFAIFRGSLLQATNYTMAIILTFYVITKLSNIFAKIKSSSEEFKMCKRSDRERFVE